MDFNLLKEWSERNDVIKQLTSDLNFLIEETCNHTECSLEELQEVHAKMGMLLEQGNFWLEQRNPKRFIYDLENVVFYLVDFLEEKDGQEA